MYATVLTRDPSEFTRLRPHLAQAKGVRLHEGDIRTFETPGQSFSHVIHGAASADAALYTSEPLAMLDTIVGGTRRTLECAAAAGAGSVLLISSGAVYGRQRLDVANVREDYTGAPDPLDPSQVYAEGKRTAEMMGAVFSQADRSQGSDRATLRLRRALPPARPPSRGRATSSATGSRAARSPSRATGRRCARISTAPTWPSGSGPSSCVASPAGPTTSGRIARVSISDVARVVAEAVPPSVPVTRAREPRPSVPSERYVPDTSRARSELGLEDWIGLEEGVRRTLAWARADGDGGRATLPALPAYRSRSPAYPTLRPPRRASARGGL